MSGLELARFALYVDLGVAFGVPVAAFLTRVADIPSPQIITAAALLGLPFSAVAFLLTVAEMAGTGLADLDWQLVASIATTTAVGWAFLVRSAALVLAATVGLSTPVRSGWHIALSATAVGSLAWSGHAAASEGPLAIVRLAADVVHLLAAAIWFGALVVFLMLVNCRGTGRVETTAALERFAGVGSLLVVLLGLTGVANLWFLASPPTWSSTAASDYGHVLGVKLALVAAMLGFAGINRFLLVPRLSRLSAPPQTGRAITALRLSIAAEFFAALALLLVVSRLGLLDPGIA